MSAENDDRKDLELLELKGRNSPKEDPKPKPVNKGTNDLETN